ncbi:MAG: hypothetical protein WB771_05560 [Solirubrobacterales bacterium]
MTRLVLRFRSSRPPAPGRYTLIVVQHLGGQWVGHEELDTARLST